MCKAFGTSKAHLAFRSALQDNGEARLRPDTARAAMFKLSGATKLNEFEFDARSAPSVPSKFQAFYTPDSFPPFPFPFASLSLSQHDHGIIHIHPLPLKFYSAKATSEAGKIICRTKNSKQNSLNDIRSTVL